MWQLSARRTRPWAYCSTPWRETHARRSKVSVTHGCGEERGGSVETLPNRPNPFGAGVFPSRAAPLSRSASSCPLLLDAEGAVAPELADPEVVVPEWISLRS